MSETIRTEDDAGVRHLVLCRGGASNTITPRLRDELSAALDDAEADPAVRVVLLRAEGPTFCAGFGLDWSTMEQVKEEVDGARHWDSVSDLAHIGSYAAAFSKLHTITKPTIAAVQGYCVAGGTDLAFNCDLIVCARSASFGYPPSRVWGVPEQPWLWVARLGLQQARRYLFTGDEITSEAAERLGLVIARFDDPDLHDGAKALAERVAMLSASQLAMIKLVLNDVAHRTYDPPSSRLLGCLFDGVARHTAEGKDFVRTADEKGWREAVRERDAPFGDYAERSS